MLTHIKAITLAESGRAGEFIIVSPLKVVFPVIQTVGEAAASISAHLYAEISSDAHGAVEAITRLGEDS